MLDQPNDEFRRFGHQVVDWMADYLENIRNYPVLPNMEPGALVDALPAAAPERRKLRRSIAPRGRSLGFLSALVFLGDFDKCVSCL